MVCTRTVAISADLGFGSHICPLDGDPFAEFPRSPMCACTSTKIRPIDGHPNKAIVARPFGARKFCCAKGGIDCGHGTCGAPSAHG
jgi:hypothetical protein